MKISSDQKPKQLQHLHWAKWWSPRRMLCWTTFHFYSKTHPGTELKFKSVIRKCPFLLRMCWFPINGHVDLFNIQYIFQTLPIHILWDIELTLIALKWNLPNCVSLCPDCVCVRVFTPLKHPSTPCTCYPLWQFWPSSCYHMNPRLTSRPRAMQQSWCQPCNMFTLLTVTGLTTAAMQPHTETFYSWATAAYPD